ncbi:MAG: hypothetical protein A3E68_01305 [Candidatus Levybacteria bacterium RIFCSPHIGHO2_12_FULL_39_39]|nr:MAG: hypothetical protein UT20_C0016G0017 [Candidatus Levybacteria bacterium GW2011_GWA1_39_11]KKR24859.1 MAG: hypothetical protein UT56_C0007G0027 [Candidatus Levybacteria bacterium GW2011_GWB1_39_7]KKR50100.1 MAG: hypothetical protein UT85_C0006G0029 [Candidatus Levybacteria bacterium GW2011_GWA2_40_16]OGH25351.1 MAG: hypothetical protein A3E68_01305 [Candidatus Levybacteria bacterium RIFCSPHIGHO2_12_FULL_39_39]OGH46953.1 MAG: hypothetical protein A3G66_00205 [Candidatus Levybacteria bacte
MPKKPDELLKLVEPWGIQEETKKALKKYLKSGESAIDIDSWIRDRRTAEQFAEQMKAYWAVEDAFAVWLEKNLKRKYPEVKVTVNGSDKNRLIVQGQAPRGKVTGNPDYFVDFQDGNPKIPVEFQFGTSILPGYDVKKNKVNKAEKSGGVILFAFLPQMKFTLLSASFIKEHGADYINPRLGGKHTWNIEVGKLIMRNKDYQIKMEDLKDGFRQKA